MMYIICFQVLPASAPGPLHDCHTRYELQSSGSVTVTCEAGWNGGLRQTFFVEVGVVSLEFNGNCVHLALVMERGTEVNLLRRGGRCLSVFYCMGD